MFAHYACQSVVHRMARRQFLGQSLAIGGAAIGGVGSFAQPLLGSHLGKKQKRVLAFYLDGGLSQFESWDPKPGTPTGGPFRSIATSVPGIHISELMPLTAQQMHHLMILRGVNTNENNHAKGRQMMLTGRRFLPGEAHPHLGAVMAKAIKLTETSVPGHIRVTAGGGGNRSRDAAYLGAEFASIVMSESKPPNHLPADDVETVQRNLGRQELRQAWGNHLLSRRSSAMTDAYLQSYESAQRLVSQRSVFDLSREPVEEQEKYGTHALGRQCLLARRLLERGATYVQVHHSNYDTHAENFNFHIEQVGEFDRAFAATVADLHHRGMLESTLIIVFSEFGRTPNINNRFGRDHWGKSWSVVVAGCGVQHGGVYGKTNDDGTEVADGEVDHRNLFHTFLQAVGVDSIGSFDIDGREFPIADPASEPIQDILA